MSNAALDGRMTQIAEEAWTTELQSQRPWLPSPGRLLVVSPHPDDETFGAGGLMHSWAGVEYPVTVISVTDGDAADARLRRRELRSALQILGGGRIQVESLGLAYGGVAASRSLLGDFLNEQITQGSTLIAPLESDGHPDHAVVGRVCRRIARLRNVPLVRYPILGWQRLKPAAFRGAAWGRFELHPRILAVKSLAMRCFTVPRGAATDWRSFERPYEAFLL
jgi:LmbE family N-acetylglucosaminyl deacetylase